MSGREHAQVKNVIIRASAGSGKTFALVQRLLRLLALGVKPQAIVALTFTRKAAGEFFARLLQKLAEFAMEPGEAVAYVPELGEGDEARKRSVALLRLLLAQMDRMRLGTLDSFFAAMVQGLPFELGLTGAGGLMSDAEERQAREEALEAMLVELMRPENEAARRELVEAWKMASFGSESNAPAAEIRGWIADLQEWFLECPEAERWGAAQRIWPDREASVWQAEEDLAQLARDLEALMPVEAFKAKLAAGKWEEFFGALAAHRAGMPLEASIAYMLDGKRGEVKLLAQGCGMWKIGSAKEVALSAEVSRLLYRVLQVVVGRELLACCARTRGRHRLVEIYERTYQRLVRGRGRLCFADLALLLAGRLGGGQDRWRERWEAIRLDMEYRLNARHDHWLFDEFQDTSRRQWRVFENLVDEVVQDPEARRSFFAVGDLKQSIYLWREAEPELFLGVEERYVGRGMERDSLRVSWRSCAQVLAMVNAVFGHEAGLRAVAPGAMAWWRFETHEPAVPLRRERGHAALLQVEQREDKELALAALLRELRPLERGLSCAVLVRKNDRARELAAYLRAELGCEVVCESEEAVAVDNPVTLALLSVLQLAAHPGDAYAWQHLRMTPLGTWLDAHETGVAKLGGEVRKALREGGFLAVVQIWSGRIREACGRLEAFSEGRLRQFLEMAADFDEAGSRDVDDFLRFARDYRVSGPGAGRALQVMTIHKSKGLEFDVVMLPDLQVTLLEDARRQPLLWQRAEDGELDWLLEKPPGEVLDWDGRLQGDVERLEARAAFEGLCRLYVAMTRAKRGLYVMHHRGGRTMARSEAGLVTSILGKPEHETLPYAVTAASGVAVQCLYEVGKARWFEEMALRPRESEAPVGDEENKPSLGDRLAAGVQEVLMRRTPSGEETHRVFGRDLLSPRRESARLKGLLVHGLFAELEWIDGMSLEEVAQRWQGTRWAAMDGYDEAKHLVLGALASAEVAACFSNREGRWTVWREKGFEMVLDGGWVSGQFDRVVLESDARGAWSRALVMDFKTDEVSGAAAMRSRAEGYAPQLQLYVKAVCRLTGLPPERVRTGLVFTAAGKWVEAGKSGR